MLNGGLSFAVRVSGDGTGPAINSVQFADTFCFVSGNGLGQLQVRAVLVLCLCCACALFCGCAVCQVSWCCASVGQGIWDVGGVGWDGGRNDGANGC